MAIIGVQRYYPESWSDQDRVEGPVNEGVVYGRWQPLAPVVYHFLVQPVYGVVWLFHPRRSEAGESCLSRGKASYRFYLPAGTDSWFPIAGKIGMFGKASTISITVSRMFSVLLFFVWFQIS